MTHFAEIHFIITYESPSGARNVTLWRSLVRLFLLKIAFQIWGYIYFFKIDLIDDSLCIYQGQNPKKVFWVHYS